MRLQTLTPVLTYLLCMQHGDMTVASKTDLREKDEKGAHCAGAPGTIKGDKQKRKSEFSKLKVSLYRKACEKVGKGMTPVWAL